MICLNNIKKIGVISDTHIPTRASELPEKIKEYFKNVDFIIHCGDVVTEDVILELNLISKTYAVSGNMDPVELNYPSELIFKINNNFIICVTHGYGSPFGIKERLLKKFIEIKPSMIIFGHTHSPLNEKYNGITFFNPGSATCGIDVNSIGIIKLFNNEIINEIFII
jgi:putative phosphoesterase